MRRLILSIAVFVIAFLAMYFVTSAQENKERLAFSNGQGTLRVGDEKLQINSVIVKLIDDHKAEITLVSDITIFLTATWANHAESQNEFDLQISGTESRSGLEGSGKVVLGNEGKSVSQLTLKGISRITKRQVEAKFEGK